MFKGSAEGRVLSAEGRVPSAEGLSAEGRVPSAEGRVLSAEGRVPSAEGRVLSAEGRVLSAEGRVLSAEGGALKAREHRRGANHCARKGAKNNRVRLMPALLLLGVLVLSACGANGAVSPTETPTLVPTFTPYVRPTLPPANTPVPTEAVTPSQTPVLVEPLTGVAVEPPIDVPLPQGWGFGYDTMLFQEVGDLTYVPIALYQGAVSGGTGTIVLIWNFRSITTGNPYATEYGQPNLWVDGLRLLRALVFDPACNLGTAPQQNYTVGGKDAIGTQFAAVDCPDAPDTKGWFAGVTVDDISFVFYVYTDPIEAMDGIAKQELQAILDDVIFRVEDFKARGAQ